MLCCMAIYPKGAIDATFRGHPENTFRIVGDAIYDGLEN